jgi:mannose-1-phosphate guanylyltransferase
VYNAPGQKKMAVAVAGLKDMVVVVNEDAVLVIPKDRAQDVRKIVIALRDRGATQL